MPLLDSGYSILIDDCRVLFQFLSSKKEMRIQKRSDAHLMNTGCAFDENKPASFFTHHFFVQETK